MWPRGQPIIKPKSCGGVSRPQQRFALSLLKRARLSESLQMLLSVCYPRCMFFCWQLVARRAFVAVVVRSAQVANALLAANVPQPLSQCHAVTWALLSVGVGVDNVRCKSSQHAGTSPAVIRRQVQRHDVLAVLWCVSRRRLWRLSGISSPRHGHQSGSGLLPGLVADFSRLGRVKGVQ